MSLDIWAPLVRKLVIENFKIAQSGQIGGEL